MSEKFTYTIGGKKYVQRPLVLGQVNQLMQLLKGMVIPERLDIMLLISLMGDRLSKALAIVLIEEDCKSLKDRNLEALAAEISFNVETETAIKVVEDFFDCNPIASLLEKLSGMTEKIGSMIDKKKTSSAASSSSSPEATSQKETPSSGVLPSPK